MKKKITTLLAVFMMALCLCLGGRPEKTVEAAAKATLSSKTAKVKTEVKDFYLYVKNCNKNARYTCTVSNTNIIRAHAEFLPDQNSIKITIKGNEKKGSAKVTVQEIIGTKKRTVGTCTVKNIDASKYRDMLFIRYSNHFSVAKGCTFDLGESINAWIPEKASYRSSNPSVASISKKGTVTTKKKGTAVITIKYRNETEQIKLEVLNKKLESKYAKHVTDVKNLMEKKITKSNFTSSYKKYMTVMKQYDEYAHLSSLLQNQHIKVPYLYDTYDIATRLAVYLKKQKNITIQNLCLDISKVSVDAASQIVRIDLKKKLTKEDIMLINLDQPYGCDKRDKSGKVDYEIKIYDRNGKSTTQSVSLKKGQKTIKFKLNSSELSFEKGQQYWISAQDLYYMVPNENSGTIDLHFVQAK